MEKKVYYEIAMYRGGCRISEVGTDKDRVLGYKGYLLKTKGTIFKESALQNGELSPKEIKRIRVNVTGDHLVSFSQAREALKDKKATHCYWCDRIIAKCRSFNNCEKHNRF